MTSENNLHFLSFHYLFFSCFSIDIIVVLTDFFWLFFSEKVITLRPLGYNRSYFSYISVISEQISDKN